VTNAENNQNGADRSTSSRSSPNTIALRASTALNTAIISAVYHHRPRTRFVLRCRAERPSAPSTTTVWGTNWYRISWRTAHGRPISVNARGTTTSTERANATANGQRRLQAKRIASSASRSRSSSAGWVRKAATIALTAT